MDLYRPVGETKIPVVVQRVRSFIHCCNYVTKDYVYLMPQLRKVEQIIEFLVLDQGRELYHQKNVNPDLSRKQLADRSQLKPFLVCA